MNLRPLSTLFISILIMVKMRAASGYAQSSKCSQDQPEKIEFKRRSAMRLNRWGSTRNQMIFQPDLAVATVKIRRHIWMQHLMRLPPIRSVNRFKKTDRAASGERVGSPKVSNGI
jgi:hypothetical protein